MGALDACLGGFLQALGAEEAHVHQRPQGAQSLVGADVGRGLLAADMLLPGLQGQHEAGLAALVHGAADNAAGHLTDKLLVAGHDA